MLRDARLMFKENHKNYFMERIRKSDFNVSIIMRVDSYLDRSC